MGIVSSVSTTRYLLLPRSMMFQSLRSTFEKNLTYRNPELLSTRFLQIIVHHQIFISFRLTIDWDENLSSKAGIFHAMTIMLVLKASPTPIPKCSYNDGKRKTFAILKGLSFSFPKLYPDDLCQFF